MHDTKSDCYNFSGLGDVMVIIIFMWRVLKYFSKIGNTRIKFMIDMVIDFHVNKPAKKMVKMV